MEQVSRIKVSQEVTIGSMITWRGAHDDHVTGAGKMVFDGLDANFPDTFLAEGGNGLPDGSIENG